MKYLILITTLMAISCKKNQPIIFNDDFDCQNDSSYCTPIEIGDTSQIQIDLTAASGNLITNGDFASGTGWTAGGNWVITGGKAEYTGLANSTLSRTLDSVLSPGYYMVKFTLSSVTGRVALNIELGNVQITSIATPSGGFTDRVCYIYGFITPLNNNIEFIAETYDISIDDVEVYKMSEAMFEIRYCTSEDVLYSEDSDGTSIEYFENAIVTSLVSMDVPTGYAIITLDWTQIDLDEGCYCLCVKDGGLLGFNLIQNPNFDSSAKWSIANTGASGWNIGGGVATHVPGGTVGDDVLEQELNTPFDADSCYLYSFTVDSAGGSGSVIIALKGEDLDGNEVTISSTTVSSFPTTISSSTNFVNGLSVLKFVCTAAGLREPTIDNVSFQVDSDCLLCKMSECVSLKEDWDAYASALGMCNMLIEGTNTNTAFGFSEDYIFRGRIFGKIRNSTFPDVENTEYKDYSGLKSLQYNDNEEVKELQVFQVPDGVHRWLRLALRSQTLNITINGTTKAFVKKPGDYIPNWRKTSNLAPVIVEIMEAQQLPPNARNV